MNPDFAEGDLVEIIRQGSFTLGQAVGAYPASLRECPVQELEVYSHPRDYTNIFEYLEGKVALIVYVKKNLLLQAVGYHVLIEGRKMFCKSNVAHKYFNLVGTNNESGRPYTF